MRKSGVQVTPGGIISSAPPRPAVAGWTGEASRRGYFRLDLHGAEASFTVQRVAGREVAAREVVGRVDDVSAGGMRLVAVDAGARMPDWSVREGTHGQVAFTVLPDEAPFALPCRLVRRAETAVGFELALQWDQAPQADIDRLVHALYRVEVKRQAARPPAPPPAGGRGRPAARARRVTPAAERRLTLLGAAVGMVAAVVVYQTPRVPMPNMILTAAALCLAAAYLLLGG